jgi:hypothetical protein
MPAEKNWFLLARTMESGEPGATALLNLDCVPPAIATKSRLGR